MAREPREPLMLSDALDQHVATRAWRSFTGRHETPVRIDQFKGRYPSGKLSRSLVLRLHWSDPARAPVVAKRCWKSTGELERVVYQSILPGVPGAPRQCYGTMDDDQVDRMIWLFLADAGDDRYVPGSLDDRVRLAMWLAAIHAHAATRFATRRLPERDQAYYWAQFETAMRAVQEGRANVTLHRDDRAVLQRLHTRLESVADHWDELTVGDSALPRTLTHGDLSAKNIRMKRNGDADVLIIDWEYAGSGGAGVDLWSAGLGECQQSAAAYLDTLTNAGVGVQRADLRRAILAGRTFRIVAMVEWAARGLAFDNSRRDLYKLSRYTEELDALFGDEGFQRERVGGDG